MKSLTGLEKQKAIPGTACVLLTGGCRSQLSWLFEDCAGESYSSLHQDLVMLRTKEVAIIEINFESLLPLRNVE